MAHPDIGQDDEESSVTAGMHLVQVQNAIDAQALQTVRFPLVVNRLLLLMMTLQLRARRREEDQGCCSYFRAFRFVSQS